MKRVRILAIGVLCLMFALPALAQEEDMMMQMPIYSVNVTERVKPGMMDEYVETTKKWLEAIKAEKMEMMFFAFGDNAGNMNYAVPITNMAEIDAKAKTWSKAAKLMRGTDWGAKRQKCIESTLYTIWMWVRDASYQPAEPELSEEEMVYMKWADLRVSSENEAKFLEVLGKIKAVYEKHGIGRPYNIYRNIVGVEGPHYSIVWGGKNPADVFNSSMANWQKMAEELKPLMDKAMDLTEEFTEGDGRVHPELSLMPEM